MCSSLLHKSGVCRPAQAIRRDRDNAHLPTRSNLKHQRIQTYTHPSYRSSRHSGQPGSLFTRPLPICALLTTALLYFSTLTHLRSPLPTRQVFLLLKSCLVKFHSDSEPESTSPHAMTPLSYTIPSNTRPEKRLTRAIRHSNGACYNPTHGCLLWAMRQLRCQRYLGTLIRWNHLSQRFRVSLRRRHSLHQVPHSPAILSIRTDCGPCYVLMYTSGPNLGRR